jgi:hypothetical protein
MKFCLSALGASSRAVDGLGRTRGPRSLSSPLSLVHFATKAAHRIVRFERPFPVRFRSRGPDCGEDGLAIRTGQLRSTRPGRTRSWSCSRVDLEALAVQRFEGRHLTVPRVADRPRLIGWSSLHPCTSPISDVLRRLCGHRLAGSRTDGKLAHHMPCGPWLALTRSTETTATPPLAGTSCTAIGTPSVVSQPTELSPCRRVALPPFIESGARLTHRSRRWMSRPLRQYRCGCPSVSASPSACLAAPRTT